MEKGCVLAIDAINIRAGGGVTHLSRLLHAADPLLAGVRHIHIWACRETASQFPHRDWLTIHSIDWAESNFIARGLMQQFWIPLVVKRLGCDILFCPGGTLPIVGFVPLATMSQNMLPFEPKEAGLFGVGSLMWLKIQVLRILQGRAFRRADGVLFLTHYARERVMQTLGHFNARVALIPHGIEERFLIPPRRPRFLSQCSLQNPFRVLYVSILMPYKHQVEVARAATLLRQKGIPIEISFVGAAWGNYGKRVIEVFKQLDPAGSFLKWTGHIPFESLHSLYDAADTFVFGSSCENLPNIMIEAMAAGLPIASSNRGPMPEILGDAGVYFDPECPFSIARSIEDLAVNVEFRAEMASRAHNLAKQYSWKRCASQSLEFLASLARTSGN